MNAPSAYKICICPKLSRHREHILGGGSNCVRNSSFFILHSSVFSYLCIIFLVFASPSMSGCFLAFNLFKAFIGLFIFYLIHAFYRVFYFIFTKCFDRCVILLSIRMLAVRPVWTKRYHSERSLVVEWVVIPHHGHSHGYLVQKALQKYIHQ